jgi:hypothetical protein
MSMHSDHHNDYFASRFDGSAWPAVLMVAAVFILTMVAWMS